MEARSSEKAQTVVIPGIPGPQQQRLLDLLIHHPDLDAIWLFGSRAMGRERPGSDIDLCIDAADLSHADRLRLMAAIDDLLLPWTVDLALRHELPPDLLSHVQRVSACTPCGRVLLSGCASVQNCWTVTLMLRPALGGLIRGFAEEPLVS